MVMFYLDVAGAVSAGISLNAGQEAQCPRTGPRAWGCVAPTCMDP